MKKLGLIFFFLAFAIKLNSQIEMSKGQLLVVKDSLSFYSFDLNGVTSFIIENDSVKRSSYKEYSKTIPLIGKLIVGSDKPYKYLVESIEKFYNQEQLVKLILDNGFSNVEFRNVSNGISAIHSGWKI